jgi:Tol biopolymer transport system component
MYAGVDLSPDGKKFAVHMHENEGGDNWIFDSAQNRMQRFTFDAGQDNAMPVWSPDGTRIAFGSRRNGNWGLYIKPADGTAKEESITESDLPKMPMSWSPDGKLLVYWVLDPKTRGDIWAVPLDGERKPAAILQSQFNEGLPQISADGKWIAYSSDEGGNRQGPEYFPERQRCRGHQEIWRLECERIASHYFFLIDEKGILIWKNTTGQMIPSRS